MPYIDKNSRELLQCSEVERVGDTNKTPGELNFIISSILWKIFKKNPKYETANMLIGVLEAVKLEFYRRQVAILEDEKIEENGDLD